MSTPQSLTLATADRGQLAVEYRWADGVFRHRVRRLDASDQQLAEWDAVMTGPHEGWPASPPIQEISLQSTPQGQSCLLGVGRAGRCHWSLSVQPWSEGRAGEGGTGVLFDIACRCPESPQWLGSTYTIDSTQRLTILPQDGAAESHCGLHLMRIEPPSVPQSYPATVCWRYVIATID